MLCSFFNVLTAALQRSVSYRRPADRLVRDHPDHVKLWDVVAGDDITDAMLTMMVLSAGPSPAAAASRGERCGRRHVLGPGQRLRGGHLKAAQPRVPRRPAAWTPASAAATR